MSLVEVVRPDPNKPARILRKPDTNELILEYTGVDNNVYRVPAVIAVLPVEFESLVTQLTLAGPVRRLETIDLKSITIFIDNGLDQDVTVQIKANRVKALGKSVNVGSSIVVPAGSSDARTLSPDTSGFLPYITVTLQCSVAPTSGAVSVYRIRYRGDEAVVVDALEIRDTSAHDASTDPTKIFVVEW